MPLPFRHYITRADVRACPHAFFVFGDNLARAGCGGQAKAMRGEPNAIGVRTKRAPSMRLSSFFSDDLDEIEAINNDLDEIENRLAAGYTVVFPSAGVGSGLARLAHYAPKCAKLIATRMASMRARYGVVYQERSLT